jgi:hypothetical protein
MKIETINELKDALKEAASTGRTLYFLNEPRVWLRVRRVTACRPARANCAVIHFISPNFDKATILLGGSDPAEFDIR